MNCGTASVTNTNSLYNRNKSLTGPLDHLGRFEIFGDGSPSLFLHLNHQPYAQKPKRKEERQMRI